ncbi:hypothetical protein HMPREF0645_0843 [Hallella bergensis DSM 17361]|uniref:Uncharacterized protein n=1 Tax=Hallella bergensis DSM 17361 TaxID=585502 RepID=D1PV58_9BACT|nr:hypothetical protein HMPREF0645_0843 [Hallella bergensis DSM 17361]
MFCTFKLYAKLGKIFIKRKLLALKKQKRRKKNNCAFSLDEFLVSL